MRKPLILALVVLMVCGLSLSAFAGTFTAVSEGFGGDITVTLCIEGDKLTQVLVEGSNETQGIGSEAVEKLPEKMLMANSVEVDALAGATISSQAILKAAADALKQSGVQLTPVALEEADVAQDVHTQIVVVGAGLAGISAAISAKDAGIDVVLLEKNGTIGGATATSNTAALWAIGADLTKEKYDFTVDEIFEFFNKQSGPVYNKDLFYEIANGSLSAYEFLLDNGVGFSEVFQCNPTADERFWGMFAAGGGLGMMSALEESMIERGIDFRLNSTVTDLALDENGNVVGVKVNGENGEYTVYAKDVILATGGHGQNPEMMAEYVPGYDRIVINITYSGATGDGHKMAQSVGGQIVGTGSLGSGGLKATSGNYEIVTDGQPLTMNIDGQQVAASNAHYTKIYSLCLEQSDGVLYTLFPSDINKYTALTQERLELMSQNDGWKADTLEDLARQIGMNEENFLATVATHNEQVRNGQSDAFNTPPASMIPIEQGPYYMFKRVPACIGTIAGVEVDLNMNVIDAEKKPIDHLYAVGELIYGNWFDHCYPMSGTCLGGCVSSARLAVEAISSNQ